MAQAKAKAKRIVFRIFYSTSFTIVFLILIAFICVTPADALYESYKRRRILDIFLISGAYVVTAFFASLVYASRWYTNRAIIRGIPKTFMPIEKEDLPGRRVHKLIQECLERSAVIAYQARPRSKRIEHETTLASDRVLTLTKSRISTDPDSEPRWGSVDHPGWSSPAAQEMPGLEYAAVIDELIGLIEAKAVSLVPADPLTEPRDDDTPLPDPRIVDQLLWRDSWSMRNYLVHLIEIDVVPDYDVTEDFLSSYERARFSAQPLSESDFQNLMRLFAELLRSMKSVEVDLLSFDDSSHHFSSETTSLDSRIKANSQIQRPTQETASIISAFSETGSVRRHHQNAHALYHLSSDDSVPSIASEDREAPQHDYTNLNSYRDGNESDDESSLSNSESRYSLRTAPTNISTPGVGSQSRHGTSLVYNHGSGSLSHTQSNSTSRMFSASSQPQSQAHSHSNLVLYSHRPSARSVASFASSRSYRGRRNSTSSRSRSEARSSPTGSVIRLARPDEDDGTGLPFRYVQ
ncbi:hypothetical protein PV10_00961 [Exophiala mesophila]|uniref:Defect at low temperature protein 1 n=1 Tax=Exophiala mesophila TaxID=212818 RepID=A0A0D1X5W5_EXOME|nr:uncharacterized protein PV10_00961 [Exophiala mesophila]KIV97180.1 hypothetical protein PV10_00961 [Exophiala mesophila]